MWGERQDGAPGAVTETREREMTVSREPHCTRTEPPCSGSGSMGLENTTLTLGKHT